MAQAIQGYLPTRRVFEVDWESLSELELVALVLGPGSAEVSSWSQAVKVLRHFKGMQGLRGATCSDLRRLGIGRRKALALLAALQLHRRLNPRLLVEGQCFRSSGEIFDHFQPQFEEVKKECFWDVLLDGKNRIMRIVRISEGSLTCSLVHPREVFRPAIQEAAAAVLFVHNHPSGDPSPSQEDLEITRRLVATGKIVGIRALDHVIIGGSRYFSFADRGLL
jgi:DNA repair protein RadC